MRRPHPTRQHGFTLLEAIIVITITAIIAAVVAVFIKAPVDGYFASARRAELTDIGDTALRRMTRDLRMALPNSVRVTSTGGSYYLEFLPVLGGGRYRNDTDPAVPSSDMLDFTQSDSSFDVLGPPPTGTAGWVVVYNLGVPGASAYNGDNISQISSIRTPVATAGSMDIHIAAKQFPFASPGNRFQVIGTPVSYVCNPSTGALTRYANYATPTEATQPTSFSSASSALLATHVSACNITYNPDIIAQQNGVVAISLQISESGESVFLYEEAHVSNTP